MVEKNDLQSVLGCFLGGLSNTFLVFTVFDLDVKKVVGFKGGHSIFGGGNSSLTVDEQQHTQGLALQEVVQGRAGVKGRLRDFDLALKSDIPGNFGSKTFSIFTKNFRNFSPFD